ncbi:TRAP-type C4-dicarboxylate transport system [Halalkalibacter wakoensis JCM 9140]|uniref:TRAP-type C4-dicarboxylate transport system n=1 Tax=Halalkalibacter wakoensis JCM 9140 TaxID=1236970 RepID=W4Q6W1_9BACI|nr:TRAP transporter substrate-binding protein [Halalkalibacter wakoensis]GAE27742.1 TRAP-type C4-dicarboxylate transport system [Halalkalibacter wakoensis JCM 9140]
MRKTSLWVSLICLFTLLLLTACGGSSSESSSTDPSQPSTESTNEDAATTEDIADAKKIVFSLDLPPTDTWSLATKEFADLVEEKTNGSIVVEVFDSAALGSQREALEGMLVGTVDGTVSLEPVSYWVEDIGLFGIPYLFESENHLETFLENEYGQELDQKMIDAGFRPLTYFMRAPRQISSNTPINSVDDLNGLQIRVPETPTAPPAFEEMGARVVTLPFGEVYSALQQNVIDAQENPLTLITANKFYEVQDYIAMTNHQYQAAYLLLSENTYQSLTPEEREAIEEAAEETKGFESALLTERIESAVEELENAGVTFTEPELNDFSDAASRAYSGYDLLMQEWIKKIQEIK